MGKERRQIRKKVEKEKKESEFRDRSIDRETENKNEKRRRKKLDLFYRRRGSRAELRARAAKLGPCSFTAMNRL